MRIVVLSDCVFPTPTPNGHGLGRMVSQMANALLKRGHDVTLIAKKGSRFDGRLVMPDDANGYQGEQAIAREALREHRKNPFDVFFDNGHLHIVADMFPHLPTVNVYHDTYQEYRRCPVLLSSGQQALMPELFDQARVIPNSLDPADYEPGYEPDDYIFFMGAIAELKQPMLAIEACARLGVKFIMAGQQVVANSFPFGDSDSFAYVGPVGGKYKADLLRKARVFLQLGYTESFGLTTLEAGLSGTPIVAWPAGGNLDLIHYGTNGVFIPSSKDAVSATCSAIQRAWYMNRFAVRAYSERLCNNEEHIDKIEDALIDCARGEWW
jgi:glycosyltransferase involved in cell wall biosynthesis